MCPQWVLVVAVLCAVWSSGECKTTTIMGADPRGGVWSGTINTGESGTITTNQDSGYSKYKRPVGVTSYDPVSKQILMELYEPHELAYAPVCSDNSDATPKKITSLELGTISDPMYGDCVTCSVTGFALYDSKIYFVLAGEYMSSSMAITRKVQIRMLDSCDTCMPEPTTSTKFDAMVNCSTHVADALFQTFTPDTLDDAVIVPAKVMKLVRHNGKTSFFLQLLTVMESESDGSTQVTMTLFHVTTEGSKELHSEAVDARFKSPHYRSLGGVDYQDGFLCWTITDRMSCGSYDIESQTLTSVEQYLFPGQGAASQTCVGDDLEVLGVVTGVSILDASERALVFGCYPQSPSSGGVGLIVAPSGVQDMEINPVRVSDQLSVKAGSLFRIDSLSSTCSFEPKPVYCVPPLPEGVTREPEVEPTPTEEAEPESEGTAEGEVELEGEKEENEIEVEPEEERPKEEKPDNKPVAGSNTNGSRTVIHSTICLLVAILAAVYV